MQPYKATIKLMVGASLMALTVGMLPSMAQAQTAAPAAAADEEVSELIVVGARAAERSAIDRKRRAATVSDSIVADDVGQFPDKNAGEAIARIAGVALDLSDSGEAGGFTIRGQAPDLIRVEVDGMTTLDNTSGGSATTGSGGRVAQLNELSSDLIKSVDVIKGQTADMTPGGVGGTVRIEQRNGLDFKKPLYKINLQAANSSLNDEWTPRINVVIGRQFMDGRLGILLNATYDEAITTQDFARVNQAGGYIPSGDWDGKDAERTFIAPYDPIAAAVTNRSQCLTAIPSTNNNSRLTCLAQFEDYMPSYVRYGRGYRDDTKLSYQARVDFRVNDNLTVFASINPNIRKFRSKDFNYQVTNATIANPTITNPPAGSPPGTLATTAQTSNFYALAVNPNHYVTSYAFIRPSALGQPGVPVGLTVAPGRPTVPATTLTTLSQLSQIRDINRDQEQTYYQTGADFTFGKWTGKARAQYGEAYADREDFVFNPGAPLDYVKYSMLPGSGLWTQEAVPTLGRDLTDPATYQYEIATNGVSNSVDLQYPEVRIDQNSESALQLDMTRDFDGDAGIFTRFKWGVQSREFQNEFWRVGNQQIGPGLVLSNGRSIDRIRVCTQAAVNANLCTLGSVSLNSATEQLNKQHSLLPEQYQAILNASIIDLPGGEFFGGIKDGAGLPQTWTTFDTQKVYSMLDEYLNLDDYNKNCVKECIATDGNRYKRRSFSTSEKTMSAYAMLDFESEVFGMELNGNVGVRFQKIEVNGQIFRNIFDRRLVVGGTTAQPTYTLTKTQTASLETNVNRTSQDALPSLNLALWPIQDKLAVRYSIAKQRARPSVTQLTGNGVVECWDVDDSQRAFVENILATNPTAIADTDTGTNDDQEAAAFDRGFFDRCDGRIGNPALVGYGAVTQNISVEWYPNRDTQVSFAVYDIDVESGSPENVDVTGYEIEGQFFRAQTYQDGPGGKRTRGFELAARTAFTFLPSFLRHTGGGFNASTAETTGQEGLEFDIVTGRFLPPRSESSYYYNANLWYDDGRINARVAYQARDTYFTLIAYESANRVGPPDGTTAGYQKLTSPQFRSETRSLDARASFNVTEKVQLFVEGKNLLDNTQYKYTPSEYREIEPGTETRWDTTYLGRKYYVGVAYTF